MQGFPSCAQEAVDYFTQKASSFVAALKQSEDGSVKSGPSVSPSSCATNGLPRQPAVDWKAQALLLQQRLVMETRLRMDAERERDRLWQVLQAQQCVPRQQFAPMAPAILPIVDQYLPVMPAPIAYPPNPQGAESNLSGQQMVAALLNLLGQDTTSAPPPYMG